jgi:hypothetical protein
MRRNRGEHLRAVLGENPLGEPARERSSLTSTGILARLRGVDDVPNYQRTGHQAGLRAMSSRLPEHEQAKGDVLRILRADACD